MGLKVVEFPRDTSAEGLAEGFSDIVRDGQVAWAVMVIVGPDGTPRFEWTKLPNNWVAIGAVEMLKQRLMEV